MPGRSLTSNLYRYGFNSKEKDNDGEFGRLTHYDYGFRIYNPGIGYVLDGKPLKASEAKAAFAQRIEDMENGDYVSFEDLKKEAETW